MRFLAVLAVLAPLIACELKPPPKKEPPAVAATPTTTPPAPQPPSLPQENTAPTPPAGSGSGSAAPALMDVTQACVDISAHIADILIKESQDPAQKAALEQDKTKIIRRSAEGCTKAKWPPEAITCFQKAQTIGELQICGKDLTAPG